MSEPSLRFFKYEGLGNDFLVVEEGRLPAPLSAARVRRLCDRRRGVGGDGILLLGARDGRPSMEVRNADGSIPEMCGNGLRCAVLHLLRVGEIEAGEEVLVETGAGPHRCRVEPGGDPEAAAEVVVWMRHASLEPGEVPVLAEAPMIEAPFALGGRELRLSAVSMGNPHAILFGLPEGEQASLGPRIERDPRFPERVNVGFAEVTPEGLRLRVWERGVGFTEACGTGACAAAVAAVESGRAERGRELRVELPGGALRITAGALGEPVRMVGPARFVFEGVAPLGAHNQI